MVGGGGYIDINKVGKVANLYVVVSHGPTPRLDAKNITETRQNMSIFGYDKYQRTQGHGMQGAAAHEMKRIVRDMVYQRVVREFPFSVLFSFQRAYRSHPANPHLTRVCLEAAGETLETAFAGLSAEPATADCRKTKEGKSEMLAKKAILRWRMLRSREVVSFYQA